MHDWTNEHKQYYSTSVLKMEKKQLFSFDMENHTKHVGPHSSSSVNSTMFFFLFT